MESEKVKEIKKALEQNIYTTSGFEYLPYEYEHSQNLVAYTDILKLINELESENEKLKEENRILLDKDTLLEMVGLLSKEKGILLNRIAELEKENEILRKHNIGYHVANNHEAKEQLKQFVERLKEQAYDRSGEKVIWYNDIDETLKEFINKGDEEQ